MNANVSPASPQLSLVCEEDITDLSSSGSESDQGNSPRTPSPEAVRQLSLGKGIHRARTSSRWPAPSTHRYLMDRQIKPTFVKVLRLRYHQTWRLSGDQVVAGYTEISDEGRPESPNFWDTPPRAGACIQRTQIYGTYEDSTDSYLALYWGKVAQRYPEVRFLILNSLIV